MWNCHCDVPVVQCYHRYPTPWAIERLLRHLKPLENSLWTQVFKNLVSNCSTYFGYSEELAVARAKEIEQSREGVASLWQPLICDADPDSYSIWQTKNIEVAKMLVKQRVEQDWRRLPVKNGQIRSGLPQRECFFFFPCVLRVLLVLAVQRLFLPAVRLLLWFLCYSMLGHVAYNNKKLNVSYGIHSWRQLKYTDSELRTPHTLDGCQGIFSTDV